LKRVYKRIPFIWGVGMGSAPEVCPNHLGNIQWFVIMFPVKMLPEVGGEPHLDQDIPDTVEI